MQITKQKNQPDTGKGSIPERVFPNQMPAKIQKTFYKNTEGRIGYGPEPPVGNPEYFLLPVFGNGIIIDDSGYGKHEHDFNVPANHGTQCCIPRCCPEGGSSGKMQNPAVPGFIDKIHSK